MDEDEFDNGINELISASIPDEDVVIKNDATFDEDGIDADSLALVETIYNINEEYGVEMEDEDIEDIETVGHLKLYVLTESNELDVEYADQLGLDKSKLNDFRQ